MNIQERLYIDNIITRLLYYFSWAFVILMAAISFDMLGKTSNVTQTFIMVGEFMIDFIRGNFEFVWITSVILLLLIGLLFSGYNYELMKEIYISRVGGKECFVNPISRDVILDKLKIYISRLMSAKDYAAEYGLSEDHLINSIQEAGAVKTRVMRTATKENYHPSEIYEMFSELLNIYYIQNKTAQDLSKDLNIPIVVPNEKLEDEYRTRFERIFTTDINRAQYPSNVSYASVVGLP